MSGNSQLIVALGATVSIYFDSPASDRCNLSGSQISVAGNSFIHTTSGSGGSLRLLVVGSDSIPTSVSMSGNASLNQFTLYAPRSAVTLSGNGTGTHYVGAFAGSTLTLDGNAQIDGDASAMDQQIPVDLTYQRERYVECTGGAMATPPDSSC
jgi:hypothetical protein